ncbi:MAG: HAMP domain-containing histidine kinase [Bacteroidales bacterium]|nr:HAMP domain-containing histidine kinase [Bacteroidales bacterium]
MFANRFAIIVFVRVVIISVTSLAFITVFTQSEKPATTLFLFLMLVYFTGSLIWYVNRTNRELANFLISIKENDTSVAFSEDKLERMFKGLTHALREVKAHFQKKNIENEARQQFLRTIVDQVGTGLICFDSKGKIELFNREAGILLTTTVSSDIQKLNSTSYKMGDKFKEMKPGEQLLLRIPGKTGDVQVAVKAAGIAVQDKRYTILSLQNVYEVMEDTEIESWKKLIRVFAHEIMNSITPIITLTTAMKRRFIKEGKIKIPGEITPADLEDIAESTEIIEERSHGLISFVERYKSLTKLVEAKMSSFPVTELFQKLERLFDSKFALLSVNFRSVTTPDNLKIVADRLLLEQVLINLVNNSLDALKDTKDRKIFIEAFKTGTKNLIKITDNGCGIPGDIKENIFMPFFSGKEGGSGIGLSISRQIVRLHKGKLYGSSIKGKETVFTIELPDLR